MRKTAIAVAIVVASFASAQMGGRMHQQTPTPRTIGEMGAMHLTVAPDGTVLIVERGIEGDALVAFTTTGNKAWTHKSAVRLGMIETSGTLVFFGKGNDLAAVNLSNGASAWTASLGGYAMQIEPAANQVYVVVVRPAGRYLVAVSNGGVVLWSQALQ